jgi:hypothetical protein
MDKIIDSIKNIAPIWLVGVIALVVFMMMGNKKKRRQRVTASRLSKNLYKKVVGASAMSSKKNYLKM